MGWDKLKFGSRGLTLPYIKQTNNKVLLFCTGNYIQYRVITHNGKEYEKGYIYVHMCVVCLCKAESLSFYSNVNQLYFFKKTFIL